MQKMLDYYGAGIRIDQVQLQKVDPPAQVIDAFRDVQAARADKERLQNEAYAYANKVVPEARGEAERILQAAQGYKRADGRRGERTDGALPQGLRGIQEGARRDPQAHVPGDHGARARRHRQDHHRRARPGRASCPTCRSTAAAQNPRRGSKLMNRALLAAACRDRRPRRRRRLPRAVHRAPERAGARARVRQAQARHHATRVSTGRSRSCRHVDYFDKRILDLDTAPQEVTASDQKRLVVDAFARYRIVDPLMFYQTRARRGMACARASGRSSNPRCAACSAGPPSRTWCATSARS